MCECESVCPIKPTASAREDWGGGGYKSLASATFTAAKPAVAGGSGVYSAAAIPRGGLFLRERKSTLPTPHTMLRN